MLAFQYHMEINSRWDIAQFHNIILNIMSDLMRIFPKNLKYYEWLDEKIIYTEYDIL